MTSPMDAWAPGVRASDVPVANGGDPNPLEDTSDKFETTAAPLRPNKVDINRHLYALFPPAFVHPHPDAWIEIAFAKPAMGGKPNEAKHFSVFDLAAAAEFAEKKNKAGFNIYVGPALRQGETGPSGRASGTNALTSLHSWVDFEKPGDDTRINAVLQEKKLLTRMTVVTGRTPNFRAHLYFKLVGSATPGQLREINEALEILLGSDNVKNADRVMRLAGTISYPPPEKVARGYVVELVTLHIRKNAPAYTIEHLTGLAGKTSSPFGFNDTRKPGRNDDELEALLEASRAPNQWHNNIRAAIATMIGRGWSDSAIRFACKPYCRDGYGDTDLDALICGGRKKWNRPDIEQAVPAWREKRANGSPIPSMHNARLAIAAIDVVCSYDTFHNKMLFGYKDDTTCHVVQPILGEVSDDGILGLRRLLSDRFGFDLTDKHVRDAVKSLALEHRFDPVADMLDEAEANWDGVRRLDRMASDHLNCEDTPLNSACVRKTMIAGVARVRNPGCKFDTILVLESPEGWNKSTVWKLLAGEENFSDEKIIGKESREVQEQLSTNWIHENADLAGMKKAEVETVKAFASRTSDRARPAYGYFQKNQPRHSIEVGTTNSDEYLQSQTGNRRFWPMRVLRAIDLGKLKEDRLQLWGEAARYQSKGESLTLDESMWPDAGVEQENRRVKDPWEAVLANIPEVVEKKRWDEENERYISTSVHKIVSLSGDQERVATSDLLTHVLEVPLAHQTTAHTMRLANVMKALGWERTSNKITINDRQVRGFFRRIEPPPEAKAIPF